jgi:hypothetical protein
LGRQINSPSEAADFRRASALQTSSGSRVLLPPRGVRGVTSVRAVRVEMPSVSGMRLALLLASLAICGASAEEVEDCTALGFTGLNRCSDCAALREFTKHEGMEAECLRCCAKDKADGAAKFHYARLEVCE